MALTAGIAFDGRSATAVTTVMALDEALEKVIAVSDDSGTLVTEHPFECITKVEAMTGVYITHRALRESNRWLDYVLSDCLSDNGW